MSVSENRINAKTFLIGGVGDVNGDGVLNIRDAVILLKYCAGMNVQLGKQ